MKEYKKEKEKLKKFERVLILDNSTKFWGEKFTDAKVITSQDELESNGSLKNDLKQVIVFCELKWENKLYQDFYGFDISRELRMRYKLLCPIILVSVLPLKFFENKAEKEIKYNILFGRGTGFIEWADINNFDTISSIILPLSEATLVDLNEMLLNLKGFVIDKITHDLQPTLKDDELKKRMNFIGNYLDNEQKVKIEWTNFFNKFPEELNNVENFGKLKEGLLIKCRQELGDEIEIRRIFDEIETMMEGDSSREPKILVIEDDPDFKNIIQENIQENLKNYFELIITDNSEEALNFLNEDDNNNIVGIISDWRLYKDLATRKYWQPQQGYEILEFASKKQFIALFSLTSEDDRNVHEIRNKLGSDILLFKKQHLTSKGQWELMADVVKQKCVSILEVIASQPTGTSWVNLKPEYIRKRMRGWNNYESEISKNANEIFNYYYKSIFENKDERGTQSISDRGIVLKNNLMNILIIRRVFMGLYFSLIKRNKYLQEIDRSFLENETDKFDAELKHHAVDIYSILKKDWWDDFMNGVSYNERDEKLKKYSQNYKNFINTTLCIKLTDLPKEGILPEEKRWFKERDIDFSFKYNFLSDV